MRIIGLLKSDECSERGDSPSLELMTEMGKLMEDMTKAGVMLATDGLQPSSKGKRVQLSNGKITVTDGPFTESKELIASYALFQVKTMDEAIEWTTRFLKILGKGQCELRPIFEAEDFPPEVFTPEETAREAVTREEMKKNASRPI